MLMDGSPSLLEIRKQHSYPLVQGNSCMGGERCKVTELESLRVLLPSSFKQHRLPSLAPSTFCKSRSGSKEQGRGGFLPGMCFGTHVESCTGGL